MAKVDQGEELTSMIEVLIRRMADYKASFFRPLGPADIQVARQALIDIQNAVTAVEDKWRSYSHAYFFRTFKRLGVGEIPGRMTSTPRWRRSRIGRLIGQTLDLFGISRAIGPNEMIVLLNVTRRGYEMLEHIVSLPSYTSHYNEQCSAFTGTSQQSFTRREALEMNASMCLQVNRLCDDVNSKQQQISLLNIYSQMVLTSHLRRLNGLLSVLTIGLLIATVLILVGAR